MATATKTATKAPGAEILAFYRENGTLAAPGKCAKLFDALPDDVAERLNVFAPPLSIFVPPGNGEKRYTDLQLRLEPRQ